jgi:branched-chain amino acid transport system ATP-binding protein
MDAVEALSEILPVRRTASESPIAFQATDVTVTFGGVRALAGVTATVGALEVAAIVGPNGAGKTTLLNAASGLLQTRVGGTIEFLGQPIGGLSGSQVARLGLGRSFQHPPLLEDETVLENILLGANLHLPFGLPAQLFTPWRTRRLEREERERARALLDFVGLSHLAEERAGGLPYGARKLADIIRAIFLSPSMLALDEPTSGLDSGEQEKVTELVQTLAGMRRMTLLLVEHHMSIVRACASQVLGMAAGRVIATGTPAEVFDSAEYRDAVVGAKRDEPPSDLAPPSAAKAS